MTGVFSINPNKTTAGGSCSPQLVTLELRSESIPLLAFQFGMVRLHVPVYSGGFDARTAAWRPLG